MPKKSKSKHPAKVILFFSIILFITLSIICLIGFISLKLLTVYRLFTAYHSQKTYFVLLQNNLELRPSGGFMGSYAKIKFKDSVLDDIAIQDIYVPDGQIPGHIEPPWPIQQAFKQGWWRLRDSNWEPDFPSSSQTINWFFEKGKEEKPDGLVAINFLVVKDIVNIFSPIEIPDYPDKINADNFYQITQNAVEKDFFPGSTQKKDFLSSITKQIFFKMQTLTPKQKLQLIKVCLKNLQQKQILLNFNDPQLQQLAHQLNWDGSLNRPNQPNLSNDYLYLVETNLGANKANCCLERQVNQEVDLSPYKIKNKVTIDYKNTSPKERPIPPLFWGGVYENFLRVIIPEEAEDVAISVNNAPIIKDQLEIKKYVNKKLQSLGFFVIVNPLSQTKVEIIYTQKIPTSQNLNNYRLTIQKQPGMANLEYHLLLKSNGKEIKSINRQLLGDTLFKL